MATHSNFLAWRIPRTEEPGRLQSIGSQELDMTERVSTHTLISKIPVLEVHLEKEMATHSSSLAWRIPGTEEPDGLPSWGRTESDMTEVT